MPISRVVISANEWAAVIVSKWIGWLLMGRSRHVSLTKADFVPGYHYVVAANHQSMFDPFMIYGALPIGVLAKIIRSYYFTANWLMDQPVLGAVLAGLGCFPAREHHHHPYGLEFAIKKLRAGHTIGLFPEGRRVTGRETTAKRGVEVLAREPGVRIIPVHIEWSKRGWWKSFRLGAGKPFDGSRMTAQEILDLIYELPTSPPKS